MDDATPYSRNHKQPANQKVLPSGYTFKNYYAFRFRNSYFISMEVGTRWEINTPLPWLEARLSEARAGDGVDHLVVILHHPLYSVYMAEDGGGDSLAPLRRPYEPLFRKYDVTAVFAGHLHIYERFYVPHDGRPTATDKPPASYPHDRQGIHHLTIGPSGSGFVPWLGRDVPPPRQQFSMKYRQGFGRGHNMARVEVDGRKLTITIIGLEGTRRNYTTKVWDRLVIAPSADS
jgi:hypothetical protein